ncbi:MAG: 3-deoxy-8-phosphooctulonate synthase, partial [Pseudomonadota bacterium]|nr:3-deoxy-8-phosphooctulonate synthase [Pseudomonadota bacterium]
MADQKSVTIGKTETANNRPFTLIAGPCAMESRQHALEMSAALCEMTARLGLDFIYKTSFDKANRTSNSSPRGVGLSDALPVFAEVRET